MSRGALAANGLLVGFALIILPWCTGASVNLSQMLTLVGVVVVVLAGVMLFQAYRIVMATTKPQGTSDAKAPETIEAKDKEKRDTKTLYYWHALLLAFTIFAASLIGSVALCLLIYRGVFPPTSANVMQALSGARPGGLTAMLWKLLFGGPSGGLNPSSATALMLIAALVLAMVGSLIHIITALREFGQELIPNVQFNFSTLPPPLGTGAAPTGVTVVKSFESMEFFVTLWLRLGQAMVYTVGVFLLIWIMGDPVATAGKSSFIPHIVYLPLYGLLIGLAVKAIEKLFVGFANRFATAAEAFIK